MGCSLHSDRAEYVHRVLLRDCEEWGGDIPSTGEPWAWWSWSSLASRCYMCSLCCLVMPVSVCGNGAGPVWSLKGWKASWLSLGLLRLSTCVFLQDQLPLITQESASIPTEGLCCLLWVWHKWHLPCWKCSWSHLQGTWARSSAGSGSGNPHVTEKFIWALQDTSLESPGKLSRRCSTVGKKGRSCISLPSHPSNPFLGKARMRQSAYPQDSLGDTGVVHWVFAE